MSGRMIRAGLTTLVSLAVAVFFQMASAQAAMDRAPVGIAGAPSNLSGSALNLVTRDRYDFQLPDYAVEPERLGYEQIRMDERGLNRAANPQPPVQLGPNLFWNQNQLIIRLR